MKITWNLVLKICISLFWVALAWGVIMLVRDSSRSLAQIFSDFVFLYFLAIVICGLGSIIVEKFRKNFILKYFIVSIFLVSLFSLFQATAQFLGLVPSSNMKGFALSFNELLFHYFIYLAIFCLSCLGIYGLYKSNTKLIVIGFLFGVVYILSTIFFFGHINWGYKADWAHKRYMASKQLEADSKQEMSVSAEQEQNIYPQDSIIHINDKLAHFDLEAWNFIGLESVDSSIPKSVFWTYNIYKAKEPKSAYLINERTPTINKGDDYVEMQGYTHFRDYSGSFKLKGILRISQSLNLKHKAPIDIMLFLDKESTKAMDNGYFLLKSPYKDDPNNHKIVSEILGEDRFKKFISKRFNYERIAIEVEIGEIDGMWSIENPIYALVADYKIYPFNNVLSDDLLTSISLKIYGFPMATILDFKTINDDDKIAEYANFLTKEKLDKIRENFAIPITKGLYAETSTKENDFFVNLRDKPDSKNGKILMQLYSQSFKSSNEAIMLDLYTLTGGDKFYEWLTKQEMAQREFFAKHKDSMINPLYYDKKDQENPNGGDYIVFIHDILEGDWAKVWILKHGDFDDETYITFNDKAYIKTFLESPSKLILQEGYIHTSSLEPISVFTGRE